MGVLQRIHWALTYPTEMVILPIVIREQLRWIAHPSES